MNDARGDGSAVVDMRVLGPGEEMPDIVARVGPITVEPVPRVSLMVAIDGVPRDLSDSPAVRQQQTPRGTGPEAWPLVVADLLDHVLYMHGRSAPKRLFGVEIEDAPEIVERLREDMLARDAIGRTRYSEPLRARNGRDPLIDAYQEALDKAVYLKQACIESRGDARFDAEDADLAGLYLAELTSIVFMRRLLCLRVARR